MKDLRELLSCFAHLHKILFVSDCDCFFSIFLSISAVDFQGRPRLWLPLPRFSHSKSPSLSTDQSFVQCPSKANVFLQGWPFGHCPGFLRAVRGTRDAFRLPGEPRKSTEGGTLLEGLCGGGKTRKLGRCWNMGFLC